MTDQAHWDAVYRDNTAEEIDWFQPSSDRSLALIETVGFGRRAPVIDIGGGASRLVDRLLAASYGDVTVLDFSSTGLGQCRTRLGVRAAHVHWLRADITRVELPRYYRVWHDRPVFHFLVDEGDRTAYLERLKRQLKPDGRAIIATFAPDGPERCSGLPVRHYSPGALAQTLGPRFNPVGSETERHAIPGGAQQAFVYCRFEHANQRNG